MHVNNDNDGGKKLNIRPLDFIKNAADEVGARVVAVGARMRTTGVGAAGGGGGDGSSASASAGASTGDGEKSLLGTVRDHTDLFTRLRATAIYIRETEAAVRAQDARAEERDHVYDAAEVLRRVRPLRRPGPRGAGLAGR